MDADFRRDARVGHPRQRPDRIASGRRDRSGMAGKRAAAAPGRADAAGLVPRHLRGDRRPLVRAGRGPKSRLHALLHRPRASRALRRVERTRMGSVVFHPDRDRRNVAVDFLRPAWMVRDARRRRLARECAGPVGPTRGRALPGHLVHRDLRVFLDSPLQARQLYPARACAARDRCGIRPRAHARARRRESPSPSRRRCYREPGNRGSYFSYFRNWYWRR